MLFEQDQQINESQTRAVQEGIAGLVMLACRVDYDGSYIHPETGELLPDTRIAAVTRAASRGSIDEGSIQRLRIAGIEV